MLEGAFTGIGFFAVTNAKDFLDVHYYLTGFSQH